MMKKGKRDQILEVAEEIFAKKGYNEATMREIAERVNMKKPSLYHHFRNKEEIYYTLIFDIHEQLLNELSTLIDQGETFEEKVILATERMVDFWSRHPNYPTILAYEIATGSEIVTTELILKLWAPRFNETIRELEKVRPKGSEYRKIDIPFLVVNVLGITVFYFFANQILSNLMGKDCLSPDMIKELKRELVNTLLCGIRNPKRKK
jgi:AcrR family transcriptional regulator